MPGLSLIEAIFVTSILTWRTTRLIMEDAILDAPRNKLWGWMFREHMSRFTTKAYELFTCWWCLPVWVAAPVVAVTAQFISVPVPVIVWWCAAGGATAISTKV